MTENIDRRTVEGFGDEWANFDQTALEGEEWEALFERYFGIFPFDSLPSQAEGFDLGCGSGRWAAGVVDRVGILNCIDPSDKALAVAKRRLADSANARFHLASAEDIPLDSASQDFGYSLGVLHHVPDTAAAMRACVRKLKPGAPFLVYLYYAFDQRPAWFKALWRLSDAGRRLISRLPFPLRKAVTTSVAATVYFPLARAAGLAGRAGFDVANWPLSAYREASFYTMRTDALDRFGTRLEQRFTAPQIVKMMTDCGLEEIELSDTMPFWVACGRRGADDAD